VAPDAAAVPAELGVQPSDDDACLEPKASSSVAVLADRLLQANCEAPDPTVHLTVQEKAAEQAKAFDEAQRSFTRLQKQMLQLVELEVTEMCPITETVYSMRWFVWNAEVSENAPEALSLRRDLKPLKLDTWLQRVAPAAKTSPSSHELDTCQLDHCRDASAG
jgi:hypothetical protein